MATPLTISLAFVGPGDPAADLRRLRLPRLHIHGGCRVIHRLAVLLLAAARMAPAAFGRFNAHLRHGAGGQQQQREAGFLHVFSRQRI
jgi:fermentation-respiration switch protein FrsA (DUF1100 family)